MNLDENNEPFVCLGQSIELCVEPEDPDCEYTWSTGATTQTLPVNTPGTYWVEVVNMAGCTASDTIYVEVWPTGLDEVDGSAMLSVFPNPTRDVLTITTSSNVDMQDVSISVVDLLGSVVLETQEQALTSGSPLNMDVSELPAGSYMLVFKTNAERIVQPFVKQ